MFRMSDEFREEKRKCSWCGKEFTVRIDKDGKIHAFDAFGLLCDECSYQYVTTYGKYCDCGSSTCDICNPGWDEEDYTDEEDDTFDI